MSAMPPSTATLPEPVFYALVRTDEVTAGASICFSIMSGILAEMRDAAKAEQPIDANDVDAWQEQLEWLLESLSSDLAALRGDLVATGIERRREGGS